MGLGVTPHDFSVGPPHATREGAIGEISAFATPFPATVRDAELATDADRRQRCDRLLIFS